MSSFQVGLVSKQWIIYEESAVCNCETLLETDRACTMQLQAVSPLRRQPYQGNRLELVIGIDVGTTFSGVSYAILRPGVVPDVRPVTR